MGLTIYNKERAIDMGYIGFNVLRNTIAKLFGTDFENLYKDWTSGSWSPNKIDDKTCNILLNDLYKRNILKEEDNPILDFLFMSDCEGKLPVKSCKMLYNFIKDYDDNVLYGYCGRPDCAMFSDFKEIVRLCAKNRWILKWD